VKQPEGPGQPMLSSEPAYVGQPIFAIAAETEQEAQDIISMIEVDLDPLPFCVDPLASLKPKGPHALSTGNIAGRKIDHKKFHWTGKDFAKAGSDKLPMGESIVNWSFGNIDAAFKESAVIVEENIVHASNSHHALEPRSAAAFWEGGKCHVWGSTQSTSFAQPGLAKLIGISPMDLVFVAEYCGGGFGGKATSYPLMALPALMSKKMGGRPCMIRVSRSEEYSNGYARGGFQAYAKLGFNKKGRMLAADVYVVQDLGNTSGFWDFNNVGSSVALVFQPKNMRFRAVPVLTNTVPKGAQRGPGENQASNMLEPLLDKAARELGIDRVQLRMVNAPGNGGKGAKYGAKQGPVTSAYLKEALEKGAKRFNWKERSKYSGKRVGNKVKAVGVGQAYHTAGYNGFDGLCRITPDGILHIHTGVGNLGTFSYASTSRVAAEVLGYDWDRCVIERGGTRKHIPFNIGQFGSNTTFTMSRTNYAAAMDAKEKLLEIASNKFGGSSEDYKLVDEFVIHNSDGSKKISFADCAKMAISLGGKYSGIEPPEDINPFTKAAVAGVKGTGLVGVAKDKIPKTATVPALSAGFVEIELDLETGKYEILDFLGVADCGTVMHPTGLAAQIRGGAIMGFGLAATERHVYDPAYGRPNSKGLYQVKPPTYLDVPISMMWDAVDEADPQSPVGAKGIGEPLQGSASSALLCAISEALGGHMFNRTPVVTDMIVNAAAGKVQSHKPMQTNCQ
jgi:CO/xanthine dehydrogenase Mo-binding subunit